MSTGTQVAAETAAEQETRRGRRRKPQLSEGAKAERRLGWLLCAPAVIVMLAVTAYPVIYAVWLSLERYNLELPKEVKFVGFANYGAVLSSPYWWQALWVTVIITVVSVAITLVLGMLLALVMYRTLFGRGTVRTAALIPYGIVTVAAAYGWQYAWTPSQGYLSAAFNNSRAADLPVQGDRRDHPGGDLEDHAVHGAAAAGRALPGARGPAEGGQGGRRHRLAALHQDHAAADEAGHPGRAAVPDAGLVPDLRQHLHPDRRATTAPDRCRSSATTTCSTR